MEFRVRTKKLKSASHNINNSSRGLNAAKGDIENVIRNVNVGRSTDSIRNSLRQSTAKLAFLASATSRAYTNLQQIATRYEATEKAIANQRKKGKNGGGSSGAAGKAPTIGSTVKNLFKKGKNWWNKHVGDPVAVESGNFIYETTDLKTGADEAFAFTRFYNSSGDEQGSMGLGWVHNYEMHIILSPQGAVVVQADGAHAGFVLEKNSYMSISGGTAILDKAGEEFHFVTLQNETYKFNEQGVFTRYENANGVGYSLEYEAGSLRKVIHDNGDFFEFSYCEENAALLAEVRDHAGRTVSYKYDGRCLKSVTDGDRISSFGYDRAGHLSDVIDARGITLVHNEYDEEGRVTRQAFADETEMRYVYDDSNDMTILYEKNESESYYFHDDLFRGTESVHPDGTEAQEYNEMNLVTEETDRNENVSKYEYDNRGNVTKVTEPDGRIINITYEKHNKPASISVDGVRKVKNVYDSKGNLLETKDALGRKISYKYNEQGRPVEIRTPGGKTIEMTYDARGNIASVVDELGVRNDYDYDELSRIISSKDGRNNVTRYEYDAYGNLAKVINASGEAQTFRFNNIDAIEEFVDYNGARTQLAYNTLGMLAAITDPLGRKTEREYDNMWNVAAYRLPNGGVVRYEYDDEGRVTKETDPLGNEMSFAYDGNGNLRFVTDAEGATTEYRYDSMDNLIYVRDPEGNETSYEYDHNGNLVYMRNANGGEVRMEYDAADQLVKETDPLGQTRSYMYTADGDVSRVIDEAGRITSFEYAAPEKPSRIVYPDGKELRFAYDENGNIASQTNHLGYTVTYVYDELNRVSEIRGSNGEATVYTYDAVGNLISAADAAGKTVYEYTLTGELSAVIDELGNRTEYEYDELDALIGITRFGGNEAHRTRYIRDLAGNVTEVIDPLGFKEKFVYNGRGELTQKTDKDGYLTQFEYDRNGEISSIRYSDGREVLMKHDALGKLSEISDWTGTTRVESDILGRVTRVTYPDNRFAAYTYGKTGERTSLTHPDGRVVSYEYDKMLRLKSLKEGDTSVDYGYDEKGQLISKTFASGLVTKYAYDNKGQIVGIASGREGKLIDSVRIAYDRRGNRVAVEKKRAGLPQESGRYDYGYDAAGRLISAKKDGVILRQYVYDAFGNRKSLIEGGARTDYSYDAMDRLISSSGAVNEAFKYDNRGNIIEKSVNGAVTNTYVYDPSNRLAAARNRQGSSSYMYNGLGHRVEERVRYGQGPEQRIQYTLDMTKYYDNMLERTVNGESDAFIWDGKPIALKGRNSYEFLTDDTGSPSRLMGMDGSNAETYGYDEFGVSLYENNNDGIQPLRYTGYRKDPAADMYFAQAREYMPDKGRFAGQDDLKGRTSDPATLNYYIYCGDMPFMYYDPDGYIWHVLAGAVVGAVVNGGFELGKQAIKSIASGHGLKDINVKKVITSAAGGAVEGAVMAATGNPYAAAAAGGFVEGVAEAKWVDGKSWGESLATGAVNAAVGVAFVGIGKAVKKIKPKWFDKLTTSKTNKAYENVINGARNMWQKGKARVGVGLGDIGRGILGGFSDKIRGYIKPTKWIKKFVGGSIGGAVACAFAHHKS